MAREQGTTRQGRADGNNSRPNNILVYQGSCNLYQFDDCVHHQLLFREICRSRTTRKNKKIKILAHEGFSFYVQVVPAFPTPHSFSVTFFLPFGLRPFFILLKINKTANIDYEVNDVGTSNWMVTSYMRRVRCLWCWTSTLTTKDSTVVLTLLL